MAKRVFCPIKFGVKPSSKGLWGVGQSPAVLSLALVIPAVFEQYVMRAAFHKACGGNYGDFCFLLELRNGKYPAVAHGRFYLFQRKIYIIMQASGIKIGRAHV